MPGDYAIDTTSSPVVELYATLRRPLLAHLTRLVGDPETAEDLYQESFLKALRAWEQRDSAASSGAWLYRIATNTAYDYLRRRRRIAFMPLLDSDQAPASSPTMESRLDEGEPVQHALDQLPPIYRVPLVLHSYEGRSTQEIATALGVTTSAVKTRLFRARERFRQVYVE
jgi:RNA polymerase sigma-70 factor, ECF subfamily